MPLLSLFVLTLTSSSTTAEGHAYVYWPHSRQYVKDPATMHSQNVEKNGIKGMTSKWGGGPPGRGGPRSSERMFWDICGNPSYSAIQGTTDSMDGFGGPPVATYEQGGEIEFIVVVNGEHGGIHQFRLCDKKVGSGLGGVKENAECLDKYFIGEGCTPGSGCGCKDDKCKDQTPHKDANDPIFSHGPAPHNIYGAHVFKFNLPAGVSCEHCTVQWYWATAFGEWFRNCIDISIKGSGGGGAGGGGGGGSRRRKKKGDDNDDNDNNDNNNDDNNDDNNNNEDDSRRRRSKKKEDDSRRRRSRKSSPRRRRQPKKKEARRRRSKKKEEDSRRRRSKPKPKPEKGRRRRRSKKEEKGRRRRRSKGGGDACSNSMMSAQSANYQSPSDIFKGQPVVDLEYESFGCFPISEGDAPAEHLQCDCNFDGKGGREVDTLRDRTCMKHANSGSPCRSGLPLYRLHVNKEAAVRLCFSFCSSRGLDLFGLIGETECRCGATLANRKMWKDIKEPHTSLLLNHDTKQKECTNSSVKVYRYIGWMRYHDSGGVDSDMLDLSSEDANYIDSVLQGRTAEGGKSQHPALHQDAHSASKGF